MSDISDKLKQRYDEKLNGKKQSAIVKGVGKFYWNPLTGQTQKSIQAMSEKSTAEGICMHVKMRALDEKGELIFKDNSVLDLMTNFDFKDDIAPIFFAITNLDLSIEEIEKN